MDSTDFFFLIVPLASLLVALVPVVLYYARKEEHSSKELREMKEKKELNPLIKQGPEAIQFLEEFIMGMEESEAGDMTEQQAKVMINVAQVLISTINKEKTLLEKLRYTDLIPKLKAAMEKLLQHVSPDEETEADKRKADQDSEALSKFENLKNL
jgi:hypothetical protein